MKMGSSHWFTSLHLLLIFRIQPEFLSLGTKDHKIQPRFTSPTLLLSSLPPPLVAYFHSSSGLNLGTTYTGKPSEDH